MPAAAGTMDDARRRAALGQFLRTRRARLSPDEVGLIGGPRRRTPGLRREEVANLAGVGAAWYTWLEQGRAIHPAEQVLTSIAEALRLTPDERDHLHMLARHPSPPAPAPPTEAVSPALQRIVNELRTSPACVTGRRTDILAWNTAAAAVFGDFGAVPAHERTWLHLTFTDARMRRLFVDWERFARDLLAAFRATSARYVGNPCYAQAVDELLAVSPEFARLWCRQDVSAACPPQRELAHPVVGRLDFDVTALHVHGDPELQFLVYSAAPGSATADRLARLLQTPCGGREQGLQPLTARAASA